MKKWISPTEAHLIPNADEEALVESLLTCDGAGKEIKRTILAELKARWIEQEKSRQASEHLCV